VSLACTTFSFCIGAFALALIVPRLVHPGPQTGDRKGTSAMATAARAPAANASGLEWTGIVIPANADGQYHTEVCIDGFAVPVLVDTGATYFALTAADARRVGLNISDADYKYRASTANGTVAVAATVLREVQLGNIRLQDVNATVSRGDALGKSLLGMSFLGRLSKVEASNGNLVLRP
jgi:aspartyl protease family protein